MSAEGGYIFGIDRDEAEALAKALHAAAWDWAPLDGMPGTDAESGWTRTDGICADLREAWMAYAERVIALRK